MQLPRATFSVPTFLGVALAVFLLMGRGLDYRTLWADEVELAERARSVLHGGLPRVIDPDGNWSLNTGGREIGPGELHRYTPWLQFYVGATGLALGKALGLSPDASVRLPFVVLHCLSSGAVAALLPGGTGLPAIAAAGLGVLYGVGTVRVIHNRTARYHALTEFLFLASWALYGLVRRRLREGGTVRVAMLALVLTISLTLHSQTLFGLLATGLFAGLLLLEFPKDRRTYFFIAAMLPAVGSLIFLVQPQEQAKVWGGLEIGEFRSLNSWQEIGFVFSLYVVSVLLGLFLRGLSRVPWKAVREEIAVAFAVPVLIAIGVRVLYFHPFSQTRYYLPIVGALVFWPLAIGGGLLREKRVAGAVYFATVAIVLVAVEFSRGPFAPFQGLRVAHFDAQASARSATDQSYAQPLRRAFATLGRLAKPGEAVLMEYVPQLVNWYAPEMRPALVPDAAVIPPIAEGNPLLKTIPFVAPDWHLYYFGVYEGFWACFRQCDFWIFHDTGEPNSYRIYSQRLERSFKFCVVDMWWTDHWANAPFMNYEPTALTPGGADQEALVLAKRCDTSAPRARGPPGPGRLDLN